MQRRFSEEVGTLRREVAEAARAAARAAAAAAEGAAGGGGAGLATLCRVLETDVEAARAGLAAVREQQAALAAALERRHAEELKAAADRAAGLDGAVRIQIRGCRCWSERLSRVDLKGLSES